MNKIIELLSKNNIYLSILTIALGVIAYQIFKNMLNKWGKKKTVSKKRQTFLKLFNNILKYILIILVLIIILQLNGINVTSIVAGLGIISLISGLALQDALKDIIMGFNLIIDNYFSVGDTIKISGIEGKVLVLGMKSTKIKDIYTNNILTISNRNIAEAQIVSNWLDIDIPLPYEKDLKEIEKVLNIIIDKAKKIEHVNDIQYLGPNEFDSSAIKYKLRVFIDPVYKPQTKRDVNAIIKETIDENNLSIPYTQIRLS